MQKFKVTYIEQKIIEIIEAEEFSIAFKIASKKSIEYDTAFIIEKIKD
jgi:hypothetical protein